MKRNQKKQERAFIIIDGSNFYHRLRELHLQNLLGFDYQRLSKFLGTQRKIALQKYYIGAVREEQGNEKSKELMRNQRILTGKLKRDGWRLGFGYIHKRVENECFPRAQWIHTRNDS